MIVFLFLINKYIKNGAPIPEVNIPTGKSNGKNNVRAAKSDKTTIIPPINTDKGTMFSKDELVSFLHI